MTLPEIKLDDRDFQSLVDEARRRIAATCPEWTEHNVSDPGITLIEQFAWMTELLLYRVNRIPDKLQLALMGLLQVSLAPPVEARTRLRFLLAPDQATAVTIPAGTAVATDDQPSHQSVVFTTRDTVEIPVITLKAMALQRPGSVKAIPVVNGTASPVSADRPIFASPPAGDDALLLGFDRRLAGLILDVTVNVVAARGVGIVPSDPPLIWEASATESTWLPCRVLSDTTGGLNIRGTVRLEIPDQEAAAAVGGTSRHWLSCRVADQEGRADPPYTTSPKIVSLTVAAAGALVPAGHSHLVVEEHLGYSDGTPGQCFPLHHSPALPLRGEDETLQVRDPDSGRWVSWTLQESLAESGPLDPHYRFDPVSGEVTLGSAVRVTGGWRQYGAIPPAGAGLRMRRYRYGGGLAGNVRAGTLTSLRDAIPGIATVTNPRLATDGADADTIGEARQHAAARLRTNGRAVTAGDYARIVEKESPGVVRARCGMPEAGKALPVYVLPEVQGKSGFLEPEQVAASEDLRTDVQALLRERAVLGTSICVQPVCLRIVTVAVEVFVAAERDRVDAEKDVADALYAYINPYVGDRDGDGWTWGRSLFDGDLAPIVRQVEGVRAVGFIRLYEVDPETGRPDRRPLPDGVRLRPDELLASGRHQVHSVVG
jgi:predicted phage baseplate assembly protein